MTIEFDMPPASASFEERGGWLVDRFMAEPSLGFTAIIHPAAIVGNLGGESGLQAINERRPMKPGSRGGWGWAQWTGPRRMQFERYCADNGYDISSDEGQYKFLCWELLHTESRALQQLKKTTELKAAVYTFEVHFERPSDPEGGLPSRIRFAERALAGARQDSHRHETAPIAPLPAPTPAPARKRKPKPLPPPVDEIEVDVSLELMPAAVTMVQLLLRGAGNYEGKIDGKFGPQCEEAMREFRAWERGQTDEPPPLPPPDMAQGISDKYTFLNTVGTLPNTILHGLSLLGTNEIPGQGSNLVIDSWRDELNAAYPNLIQGFSDDGVPWCGLFVAVVCHRAEACSISNPLWARNWAKLGTAVDAASLGDVLVFVRPSGGHVGFYIAEDDENYHVLGGNQSDSVTITRVAKSRCIAVRRPPLLSAPPASVKPYHIAAGGEVSTNEA